MGQLGLTAARTAGIVTVVLSESFFRSCLFTFESGGITKHLMTGPSGNSEFCFPSTGSASPRGTLRSRGNKTHCFLWAQSLGV